MLMRNVYENIIFSTPSKRSGMVTTIFTTNGTKDDTGTDTGDGQTDSAGRNGGNFVGTGRRLQSPKKVPPKSPKLPKKAALKSGKKATPKSTKKAASVNSPKKAKVTKPASSPQKKTPSTKKTTSVSATAAAVTATAAAIIPEPKPTPKVATTKVLERNQPPVQNLYGEDQMPSDCDQRLQQCIIFLSDEGPENHPRFKDKLKKLEYEIGVVWPTKKRQGHVDYQYSASLHRKVVSMMEVQRARVDAGARKWFQATMFPQYPPSDSEASLEYPLPAKAAAPGIDDGAAMTTTAIAPPVSATGGRRGQQQQDPAASIGNGVQDDHHHDQQADRQLTQEERKAWNDNPWAQQMPRPEVWHRRMPNLFPFGETPYMENVMSKQIQKDLGEDQFAPSTINWLQKFLGKTVVGLFGGGGGDDTLDDHQATAVKAMWALPFVDESEVEAAIAVGLGQVGVDNVGLAAPVAKNARKVR